MRYLKLLPILLFLSIPYNSESQSLAPQANWVAGYSVGNVTVFKGYRVMGWGSTPIAIPQYEKVKCCVESNSSSACDFASDSLSNKCPKGDG
tara:strand:+ start:823 stop:1098 length:276 start_codon:yes stop_codon:yes gene_type:complete